jgi:hypothetical protein
MFWNIHLWAFASYFDILATVSAAALANVRFSLAYGFVAATASFLIFFFHDLAPFGLG